jgi:hypothetical protein
VIQTKVTQTAPVTKRLGQLATGIPNPSQTTHDIEHQTPTTKPTRDIP